MSLNPKKHANFLRLRVTRVTRALEELRLISQLSSPNYDNTPQEAEEIIISLDGAVRHIAELFGVTYATRIGTGSANSVAGASKLFSPARAAVIDELEAMKLVELIRAGRGEEAEKVLLSAISGKAAA